MLSRFARDKKTPHERLCDYYCSKANRKATASKRTKKCYSELPKTQKSSVTYYTNYEILKQLVQLVN